MTRSLVIIVSLLLAALAAGFVCEDELAKCLKRIDKGKKCQGLPLPDNLLPPVTVDAKGYNLTEYRKGVYSVGESQYFMMIVKTSSQLIVVDGPEGNFLIRDANGVPIGTTLTDAIKEIAGDTKFKRIKIIYSHQHYDHIGAVPFIYSYLETAYPKAQIKILAHSAILKPLINGDRPGFPLPTVLFDKKKVLKLRRNLKVIIKPQCGGHTPSDLIIHIPKTSGGVGVAYLVDVIFPRWAPPYNLAIVTDIHEYIELHSRILALDIEVYIGGHFTHVGTYQDVLAAKAYLEDLLAASAEGLAVSSSTPLPAFFDVMDPSSRWWGNLSHFVKDFTEAGVAVCSRIMIEKWGCRLGGVDIWVDAHCESIINFLRLDN
ncbi:hypothetical protein NDN08_007194 [Rhodosorus marinus]|uniref:Metallo-beta-lactamase domain-containing protein n=1 Tax=Rhodosorus marinus TaxID=101924 RepID=A0AAV8UII8_9RHOD|nr:hypothetical protein NDN08_007194 [Rhodosorus marinus]